MITIPYSKRVSSGDMIDYFTLDIGGCLNPVAVFDDSPWKAEIYQVQIIHGGELDGYLGLIGHNAEKHVSWSIAPGGGCLYIEMIPPSCETAALLVLS